MRGTDSDVNGDGANGATLAELSEKLTTLRKHLDELLAGLGGPQHGGNGVSRPDLGPAASERPLGNGSVADEQLRCRQCGRVGSKGAPGWTLRLCADDELHAFCADCDRRHFDCDSAEPAPASQDS